MPIRHPALYSAVYACLQNAVSQISTRSPNGRNRVFRSGSFADAGETRQQHHDHLQCGATFMGDLSQGFAGAP